MAASTEIFYELAETIDEVGETERIPHILGEIAQLYGLKTVAYLGTNSARLSDREPYIAVTYSAEWVTHYKAQGYLFIDPVIREGFNCLMPIDWRDFDKSGARIRQFLGEAVDFGLGQNGLTFPVRGMHGNRALVTITSDTTDREWQTVRRLYMRDFQALAGHLHQMVLRSGGNENPQINLSKRQTECLWWISQGKNVPEIAIILELSRYTVKDYLEDARAKLNATSNSHAAFTAAQLGLLFPVL
jgi:DNA-binding CsgD family transcriptional regulator